jgi:hypothetical protein
MGILNEQVREVRRVVTRDAEDVLGVPWQDGEVHASAARCVVDPLGATLRIPLVGGSSR